MEDGDPETSWLNRYGKIIDNTVSMAKYIGRGFLKIV